MKETIVKINKTKTWVFEKINKTDRPLSHSSRTTERRIKSTKLEMKQTNAEMQRIIRDYYEQPYGNKIDNLEEMDRFLEEFNLPRLNQKEIEIMNNPFTSTEI